MSDSTLQVNPPPAQGVVQPHEDVSWSKLCAAENAYVQTRTEFLAAMWNEGHASMQAERSWANYKKLYKKSSAIKVHRTGAYTLEQKKTAKRDTQDALGNARIDEQRYQRTKHQLAEAECRHQHADASLSRKGLRFARTLSDG